MSEEEIINKFINIINSIYITGFRKDTNGEISNNLREVLDLYNKQKQQIKSLERENAFLKQIYSRTEEFKSIERLANNE